MKARILGAVVGIAALVAAAPASAVAAPAVAVPAQAPAVAAAPAALPCGMTIEYREISYSAMSGLVYYRSCTHFSGRVKIAKRGGGFTTCKTVAPYDIVQWGWVAVYGIGEPVGVRSC